MQTWNMSLIFLAFFFITFCAHTFEGQNEGKTGDEIGETETNLVPNNNRSLGTAEFDQKISRSLETAEFDQKISERQGMGKRISKSRKKAVPTAIVVENFGPAMNADLPNPIPAGPEDNDRVVALEASMGAKPQGSALFLCLVVLTLMAAGVMIFYAVVRSRIRKGHYIEIE